MSEELIAIIVLSACLIVVAVIVALPFILRAHSRELMRMVYTADERVKAAWTQGDRAISRIVAAAFPESHRNFRQQSGTVDGAQYRSRPHYEDEATAQELVESKKQELADLSERIRDVRAAMTAEPDLGEPKRVGTQLDFERNGA